MFSKLKEKLKKSLSVFSRKADRSGIEADIEDSSQEKAEPVKILETSKPSEEKISEELHEELTEKKEKPGISGSMPDIEKTAGIPVEEESKKEKKEKRKKYYEESGPNLRPEKAPAAFTNVDKIFEGENKAAKYIEEAEDIKEAEEEPVKKSFFSRARDILTTKKLSEKRFEELFWDLEVMLLENNVAVDVIQKIKEDLKHELVLKQLPRNVDDAVTKTLKKTIDEVLSVEKKDIIYLIGRKKPFIITFFGVNGSGKTTSIAKLANYLNKNKLSCVMAACDTFRAAAIHQLEEHASNLKVKLIKHGYGADASAVAFDAVKFAEKNMIDVVLIDTAGRLHSDVNLMEELKKLVRVSKPDLKIFVGESITGNDCIEQARRFEEAVGIDGIILTKADVDEKGGTALSISYVTEKPILYLGNGQGYDDLMEFSKEFVLRNIGLV